MIIIYLYDCYKKLIFDFQPIDSLLFFQKWSLSYLAKIYSR